MSVSTCPSCGSKIRTINGQIGAHFVNGYPCPSSGVNLAISNMTPTLPPNCRLLEPEEIVQEGDLIHRKCFGWGPPSALYYGHRPINLKRDFARPVATGIEPTREQAMRAALEEIDAMIPEDAKLPLTVAIREVARKALGR